MFGRRARSGPPHALYPVDLPGLDEVQWAEVAHAYGPATDVPGSIRGLASRDPEERKEAIGALFGTVWHQGTVYGATAPAVPFLVRVAITADVPDREHVLGLLAAISAGHGYVEVHRRLMKNGGAIAEELDAQEQTERRWVADAHAAVLTAAPDLVGLLGDLDVEVRRAAAYTLASLDEEAQTISAELAARFRAEDDAPAAASQVLALAALARRSGHGQEITDVLRLAEGRGGVVRLATAVVSAALANDDKQARAAVDNFVSAPGDGYEELDALLWAMDGGPVALMGAAVGERPALHVTLAAGLINVSDSRTRVSAVVHAGETIRRWRSVTAACVDLLGRAACHTDARVRRRAVSELAFAFPACGTVAHALARNLDEPESRWSAIVTLARLGDARAYPIVAAAVHQPDPPPWVGVALKGLGAAAADGLLEDVLVMLTRLPAPRRGAGPTDNRLVHTLNWIGGLGPLAGAAVPHLRGLMEAGRAPVPTATALARIGPLAAPAAPALRAALAGSTDAVLQSHAAFGVWEATGDPGPLIALGRDLIGVRGHSSVLLGYLEQVGPRAAELAGLLAGQLGEGLEWDRVQTARSYWKLTGDTDRALPELLALADTNPAGMAAIEALGWLGPAALAIQPQLEDWLARDLRLGGTGAINDAVERDETFRATARITLAAVTAKST